MVPGMATCQMQVEVSRGQQDLGGIGKYLRLVALHPQKFRRGEPRKDDIAAQISDLLGGIQLSRLSGRTGVVPQDAGPQHLIGTIQQHRTVHMTGNRNAANIAVSGAALQLCHRLIQSGDPVAGILFRPAGMGGLHVILRLCRGDRLAGCIGHQRAQPRCAKINTKIHGAGCRKQRDQPQSLSYWHYVI